jgi:membrane protein
MRDISPESPEARLQHPDAHPQRRGVRGLIGPGSPFFEFWRRVLVGVYNDGFIHAGNLAYLTLIVLFPFFIIVAAAAQFFGGAEGTAAAIHSVSKALPPSVASLVETTANEVISLRTGPLLWFGAAIGIWTVGSFIETIRDILRRAYGTPYSRPFWHYRLLGIAIIFGAVALLLAAFSVQIFLTTAEQVVTRFLPIAERMTDFIGSTRIVSVAMTFVAIYLMFWTLSPSRYRRWRFPKWPGALFTTAWWYGSLTLLPRVIELFGGYTLTYGGLAGVMVALLFFWLVGYGLVMGAHINAALANPEQAEVKEHPVLDELTEARWLDT